MCGNWLYTGVYTEAGNNAARRDTSDPIGLGYVPQLGVLLARQSAHHVQPRVRRRRGAPWDPKRPGIVWNGKVWKGDVPDIAPDSPPGKFGAFIMLPEGVGRLYAPVLNDGPFAEHYEAIEAPIANPLHPKVTSNPVSKRFSTDKDKYGTAAEFPVVCSTYRLTEMYHYWTQHNPRLNQLQPGFFVELPAELAKQQGIANGDQVKVISARGAVAGRGDGDRTPAVR